MAQQLPSYSQDTSRVLKVLDEMRVPADCFLVTLDVESLYTNITHDDGLNALQHFLRSRPTDSLPPSEFILQLKEWTFKNNVFIFQDQPYTQVRGTAMGACFAPNYAHLIYFLGLWEQDFIYHALYAHKDLTETVNAERNFLYIPNAGHSIART